MAGNSGAGGGQGALPSTVHIPGLYSSSGSSYLLSVTLASFFENQFDQHLSLMEYSSPPNTKDSINIRRKKIETLSRNVNLGKDKFSDEEKTWKKRPTSAFKTERIINITCKKLNFIRPVISHLVAFFSFDDVSFFQYLTVAESRGANLLQRYVLPSGGNSLFLC
jgi:hypothetical protein